MLLLYEDGGVWALNTAPSVNEVRRLVQQFKVAVENRGQTAEGRQLTSGELKFANRGRPDPTLQEYIAQLAAGFHNLSPADFPYNAAVQDFPLKAWGRKHPKTGDGFVPPSADARPARRLSDLHPGAADAVELNVASLKHALDSLHSLSQGEPLANRVALQIAEQEAIVSAAFAKVSTLSLLTPSGPDPRKRRAPEPASAEAAAAAYWEERGGTFCRLTGQMTYPEPVGTAIVEELIATWLTTVNFRTPGLLDFLRDVGGFEASWKKRYFSENLLKDVKDFVSGRPEFAHLLPVPAKKSERPKRQRR